MFVLLLFFQNALAQDAQALKKAARDLLANHRYEQALDACLRYEEARPGDGEVLVETGICYFHLNQLDLAEICFNRSFHSKKTPPPMTFLYLGRLHHARLDFEKAAGFYKSFLKKDGNDPVLRAIVKDDIRRCAAGIRVRRMDSPTVINLGDQVNSPGDEFKPLLSPNDASRLYFSYKGSGLPGSDIMISTLDEGDWSKPRRLAGFVNSDQYQTALGFDKNGSRLYFFRGESLRQGRVLVDTFRENAMDRLAVFEEMAGPEDFSESAAAPFFFNDTILLFASRRPGGFGGLDLFVSTFSAGQWSQSENLGAVINSPSDETAPFLAADGRTLFFSTNDPARSAGGFDVLKSVYLDHTERWSPAENLGLSLNSAADDLDFRLTQDGSGAFFSSARMEGFGGRDLYVALFDQPERGQFSVSWPATFQQVPAYHAAFGDAVELDPGAGDFFEKIDFFEIPVLDFPATSELPKETLEQLKRLALLMKKFPETRVLLAAATSPQHALTPLDQAASYLRKRGVPMQNLALRTVPSGSQESGSRLHIFLTNTEKLPFAIRYNEPDDLSPDIRFFRKTMTGFFYQVQIPLDGLVSPHQLYDRFPEGMIAEHPGSKVPFFVTGLYLTWKTADAWQQELLQNGYSQASVTAWMNGWELSKEEAVKYVGQFPDLKNFIGR